ncbi:hypothetical protein [Nocardia sp. BMG111209]|uniref:hypothetical protein n=1 Tax=Nocardia sp. BMG111209 TaxID=1160137 RepID=UPI000369AB30|nr:hypothetical protein [Nocardia sp. BMG111209]
MERGSGIHAIPGPPEAGVPAAAEAGTRPLRMALKPGARTADVVDLSLALEREQSSLLTRMAAADRGGWSLDERIESITSASDKLAVISDLGRYAALRGVDAYWSRGRWVVLNRTALVVEP